MVYTACSWVLAMAEIMLQIPHEEISPLFTMLQITIPDRIRYVSIEVNPFPFDWNLYTFHPQTTMVGGEFTKGQQHTIPVTRSEAVTGDHNFLINPLHQGFSKIKIVESAPFGLEKRLFYRMTWSKGEITKLIKSESERLGFDQIGISKAEFMSEEAVRLEAWLNNGSHGKMSYMENHFDKRVDPTKLVPGAKSVVSLSYNYYNPTEQSDPAAQKISMYAYGQDYHKVVKDKLYELINTLEENIGEINGRCFVDSAPVLERDWAKKSGLGWTGKHTLLINKKRGSYFFLAELIIDVDLDYDHPVSDHCGTCTRCIDACPTDAITENGYILEAEKCISYLTIELKDEIPPEYQGKMENWMFGCDICQQVCPWNRFSEPHNEPKFEPKSDLMNKSKNEWEEITQDVFSTLFKGSAVQRTKFSGLKRNIEFLRN